MDGIEAPVRLQPIRIVRVRAAGNPGLRDWVSSLRLGGKSPLKRKTSLGSNPQISSFLLRPLVPLHVSSYGIAPNLVFLSDGIKHNIVLSDGIDPDQHGGVKISINPHHNTLANPLSLSLLSLSLSLSIYIYILYIQMHAVLL